MTETIDIRAVLPEGGRLPERTGDFIAALLQAFFRTGSYQPGQAEAHKAKAELYEMFVRVVEQSGEISFLLAQEWGGSSILIEGLAAQPLRMHSIMPRGLAEIYTPHFVSFLQRKGLIALSLNARMNAWELSQVIDIMSEPSHSDVKDARGREQFVQAVRFRHINNISFLFTEEFITDRHTVPWCTCMALSRLKKEIHLLSLLKNRDEIELHQFKRQILADLLRPLGAADLIYALLINLDLAASPLMSEEDGERHVFALTGDSLMSQVGHLFVEEAKPAAGKFPGHATVLKKGRLLAGLSQRLAASTDPQAGAILEALFTAGMIPLEALPAQQRDRILTDKRVTAYLVKADAFLEALDTVIEPDLYATRAQTILNFVPSLVEQGKLPEVIAILELINRHAREQSARAACAIQCRAELVFGETLTLAAQLFLTAGKETRTLIGQFFQLVGHGAIPHLQRILIESDDPWRSKQAAEALIGMGGTAVAGMISACDSELLSTASVPVVLRIMSALPAEAHKNDIIRLLQKHGSSGHDDTRREALAGLCRFSPGSGFLLFRAALTDSDPGIRKSAVRGIGLAGDRRAVELLAGLVEAAEKTNRPEDLELAVAAVGAMGALMDSCLSARTGIQAYLKTLVDRYCSGSIWKNIMPGVFVPPVTLLLSLTETSAKLQGAAAQSHLARLSHHRNQDVAKLAAELLRECR